MRQWYWGWWWIFGVNVLGVVEGAFAGGFAEKEVQRVVFLW
jgi:hypothetical protein